MICVDCGTENLPGNEVCLNCGQDLTLLETTARLSIMEVSILESSLVALRPKAPIFVRPDCTVGDAIANLCANHIGCVLIGDDFEVEGIFSERDALLRTADRYDQVVDSPVRDFMTPDPVMLELDTPMAYALNIMSTRDFRHLPVKREGLVIGIVSLRDVIAYLARWYPNLLSKEVSADPSSSGVD